MFPTHSTDYLNSDLLVRVFIMVWTHGDENQHILTDRKRPRA